ncbi:MAG: DUF2505 domain-containing protein [Alcanivorax sp.]|nr:DUF2505 domain-containing protein [Alcanivorax sp.]
MNAHQQRHGINHHNNKRCGGTVQEFTNTQQYSQPVDQVLARYTDPDFLIEKYRQMAREEITLIEHSLEGDQARLCLRYYNINNFDLPSFARKFVSDRTLVTQTAEWQLAERLGQLFIEPKGAPARMTARMQLSDNGAGGCINRIQWQVSCSVPIVGGKLEKLMIDNLRDKAAEDESITQALLDRLA